jgi:SagB-type dehydrogenase family enzyme
MTVSPLVTVRWSAGRAVLSVAGAPVGAATAGVLRVLDAFAGGATLRQARAACLSDVDPETLQTAVERLCAVAALVPAGQPADLAGQRWTAPAWEFRQQARRSAGVTGAVPASPAVAPPRSSDVVTLPQDAAPGSAFTALLRARASRRSWSAGPLAREQLGTFLASSAGNRVGGYGGPSRPYPSGGACYSLELYPVLAPEAAEGVPAGVYRLRPETAALERLSTTPRHYEAVLAAAAAAMGVAAAPPIVVVVTSRFERAGTAYGPLAYDLVLKEVGALLQTMYLVGEHLGLAVCALGGGTPERYVHEAIGSDELTEPVVGELALGGRAVDLG